MRLYDLPDGQTIDLDAVVRIGALVLCPHDSGFDGFEVYFVGGDSINIMESDLSRTSFIAALSGQ